MRTPFESTILRMFSDDIELFQLV